MARTMADDASEQQRLAWLREYEILDTPPEQAFDDLVALASAICGVPIALISLVDRDRQWFKARRGLAAPETPRAISFCTHAIEGDEIFVVPDAAQDVRFADNPLVTGAPYIRFYAGVPIAIHGHTVGTLCVIDRVPRELTTLQHDGLAALGRQVRAQLELRRNLRELEGREAELARQRDQLVLADRRRQELTELIIHDLKNPLTTILPCSELVLEDPGLSSCTREAAEAIHAASDDMHRMVLDLLDVNASADGQLVPAIADVELGALLTRIERAFAHRCALDHRRLEIAPPAIARIRVDHDLVRRTLENLVDNALKYARGGSAVVLTHAVDGDDLVFRVADEGPGIPADERAAVFDKHVRLARDARHHARVSRGLGLAFCRLAVEAHGGQIWIEDNALRGSVFCVRLPVMAGAQ